MKNRKIVLGFLGATMVALTVLVASNSNENGVYQSRVVTEEGKTQSIKGAFDYYNMIWQDVETGEFNVEAYNRAKAEVDAISKSGNRAEMTFLDQGPDNIGGRTRAILIDKDNFKTIYAGSVSGGLFKSTNRASSWKKVEGLDVNLAVSSMCQTDNGNIYVATGHQEEQFFGNNGSGMNGAGIFVSTDDGVTFTLVPDSDDNAYINEIVAKGNDVIIAGSEGLTVYDGSSITDFTASSGACPALAISPDQEVIVASLSNDKTHISTDGGNSFTNVSGSANGQIPFSGVGRMEYAISHEKLNGKYYVYAMQSTGTGRLKGVFYTSDYGVSWTEIAPQNNGNPGDFAPFGSNSQGNYNNILAVVKGNPEAVIIGG
ncbi:MAG: hypothetical protein AB8B74_11650, partial [Crocinitomicaceae bacterium]